MNKIVDTNIKVLTDPRLHPYSLQMDQYCYAVFKEVKARGTGKSRKVSLGYTTDIEKCFQMIKQDAIRDKDYNNLHEYIDEMTIIIDNLNSIQLT